MPSNSASKSKEFAFGLTSPVRALALLLEHPDLLKLFLLPMATTLAFISVTIYALLAGLWKASQTWFYGMSATPGNWAPGILTALGGGLLLYLAFSSLNLLIQLVASPFNDLLSEKTEQALGEPRYETSLGTILKVFWLDLRKTLLAVSLYLALSILAFIPGLALLCIPGFAMIQAFGYLTYPQSRRKHGVRKSITWMFQNPFRSLGLGVACLVLFAIPVINLFALPLCVMAGTLVYHRK